jgi:hypothetical protein
MRVWGISSIRAPFLYVTVFLYYITKDFRINTDIIYFTPGPNNIMSMTFANQDGLKKTQRFMLGVTADFHGRHYYGDQEKTCKKTDVHIYWRRKAACSFAPFFVHAERGQAGDRDYDAKTLG